LKTTKFFNPIYGNFLEIGSKLYKLVDSRSIDKTDKKKEYIDLDGKIYEKIKKRTIRKYKSLNDLKKDPKKLMIVLKNSNIDELVLFAAFKYDKYSGISFNSLDYLFQILNYSSPLATEKLKIIKQGDEIYHRLKDIRTLCSFVIKLKDLQKFNFSNEEVFIITNFLAKTRFHQKNIENFKIMKNIVKFFIKKQRRREEDGEKRDFEKYSYQIQEQEKRRN